MGFVPEFRNGRSEGLEERIKRELSEAMAALAERGIRETNEWYNLDSPYSFSELPPDGIEVLDWQTLESKQLTEYGSSECVNTHGKADVTVHHGQVPEKFNPKAPFPPEVFVSKQQVLNRRGMVLVNLLDVEGRRCVVFHEQYITHWPDEGGYLDAIRMTAQVYLLPVSELQKLVLHRQKSKKNYR